MFEDPEYYQDEREYDTLHYDELERDWDEPYEPDNWADADALASAGMGTDEDYYYYGDE